MWAGQCARCARHCTRAAVRSPDGEETARRVDSTQQRPAGHPSYRQAGPLPHRHLDVGTCDSCHRRTQERDRLLERDRCAAAFRGLQVDERDPTGWYTSSPQAREQLPPTVRGCPATDDYAPGLGRRNRLNQGLRRTADLCKHQRSSRSGQLATQSGNKLARANRYRLGADVTAYDYDRRLPLSHQPAGATAK